MPVRIVTLGLTLLLAGGCRERELDWDIQFEPPSLADGTARLDARISEGACSEDGSTLWEATLVPRGAVAAPPSLPRGDYCFEALAGDAACNWFATGQTDVALPMDDGASLSVLVRAATPSSNCDGECMGGTCSGGGADAGGSATQTCLAGDCAQDCPSDCNADCIGGGCAQRCGAGASCSFDCIDTCSVECTAGSSCAATCIDSCTMTCRTGASCDFLCPGGDCTFVCEDPGTCRTSCAGGGCTGP